MKSDSFVQSFILARITPRAWPATIARRSIGMLFAGKRALLDLAPVGFEGGFHCRAEFGVALDEFWRELGVQSQQVVHHKDLAVAVGPRADADGGHADGPGDLRADRGGHALDNQAEDAGLVQLLGGV